MRGVLLALLLPAAVAADGLRLEDYAIRPVREVSIDALAWQAGQWFDEGAEGETLQWIGCPRGRMMLGVQQDLAGGETRFFEFQRYAEVDGGLVFFAQPLGKAAVPFVLVELGEQRAVFENHQHDFPQRIVMQRRGDRLTGRIEGQSNGVERSSEWGWRLVPPAPVCDRP